MCEACGSNCSSFSTGLPASRRYAVAPLALSRAKMRSASRIAAFASTSPVRASCSFQYTRSSPRLEITRNVALPQCVISCQHRACAQPVAPCLWKEGRVPLQQARGDREEPLLKNYYQRRHRFVRASMLLIGALLPPLRAPCRSPSHPRSTASRPSFALWRWPWRSCLPGWICL